MKKFIKNTEVLFDIYATHKSGSLKRYSNFEIVWIQPTPVNVTQAETGLTTEFEHVVYCISPGQVYKALPGYLHKGIIISFSLDFISKVEGYYDLIFNSGLFYTYTRAPIITIDEEITGVLAQIEKEFGQHFLYRTEILRAYLKIILIYLSRLYQHNTMEIESYGDNNILLIKKFISLLDKNHATKTMVADYADKLCITPNHLNTIVKKISGMTASQHINQRLILEVKRQALNTDASMKEIAYNLGFTDPAHFSKFFKKTVV